VRLLQQQQQQPTAKFAGLIRSMGVQQRTDPQAVRV
jgi:hypothetical protein